MKPHSQKFLQQRRFFMVLPMLVMPFLVMIFWAFGGGQATPVHAKSADPAGLNPVLPDAHFDEAGIPDKLSLYEMAERDSARFAEARKSDPYFDLTAFHLQTGQSLQTGDQPESTGELIGVFPQEQVDPNEKRVAEKLNQLYRQIDQAAIQPFEVESKRPVMEVSRDPQFTQDVDRLENMMEMMHNDQQTNQMEQINGVLEKILDIQHPQRVREKLKEQRQQNQESAFAVEVAGKDENISLLEAPRPELSFTLPDSLATLKHLFSVQPVTNRFYGLEDDGMQPPANGNTIQAVIHDTQELVAGSTIKLRLIDEVMINGMRVPKDQFVYGTCAINGERMTVKINSVRTGNSLLPVSLSVYDLDGQEGIYIPGAITRDAAKQASDNALQSIQLMSLDPSIAAQAAAAGVEAAKGLFSKKAKLIKVTVKAGYHVLLKDTNPAANFQNQFM